MQIAQIDFNALFGQQGFGKGKFTHGINQDLTIGEIINTLLPYLFIFSGLILLLMLIYGGIQLMLSSGDPQKIKSAQSKITDGLIGFVIIFVSYWLVLIVGNVLGIDAIKNIFQ
ncbi:hypothetical protein HY045_04020 [Candidatus Woesebacteria bacterium]|nr:hypothetical protein [Candidatus Woesebacteria bacterium]